MTAVAAGQPGEAQYLLRFDDLCPTMNRARWERFLPLLERYGIQPILAVVPDNRDPELVTGPSDAEFWAEMQRLQATGAAIGLHGYQHLCFAKGGGLVPFHANTEFAGAPRTAQRQWIGDGLRTLRSHGLEAKIWVAPRHGTDAGTVEALMAAGLGVISDGLALRPYRELGAVWLPQQLWEPVEKRRGLWTVCLHANTASDALVGRLEAFLANHAGAFTSVERVLAEWPIRERTVWDRWVQARTILRLRVRKALRR